MHKFRLLLTVSLFGLAAASIGACASAPLATGAQGSAPDASSTAALAGPHVSTYGLFLAGHEAADHGDGEKAADFYLRALNQSPEALFLKDRAFFAALEAGDVRRAAQIAPALDEAPVSDQQLGRLTVAADALADGRPHDAELALAAPFSAPNRAGGLLLAPWAAAAAGNWKAALALPDPKGDRLFEELSRLNHALLLERTQRYDLAEADFRQMLADGDGSGLVTSAYVEFLERRGRRADAVALCDAALKGDPSNRALHQIRDQAAGKTPPPPMPTLTQGAARALIEPAAIFLAEKQPELGLNYLRLILRLDPSWDEAWMLVGDTKAAEGDIPGAREAYLHIAPTSPDYVDARGRLIETYDQPGDAAQALALLADALRGADQFDESAKVMDTLMTHLGDQAGWQAYYMRGVALDRSGHWPEAERDFRKALQLKPDESEVLNYLGYSWIDRGEKLQEAKSMVERAVSAKPDSGAMVDSLGWAYFRLGDFSQAVEQLERAAELEPADPDINNHLGDAYWRAGRKIEARFQWERVLSLGPTDKMRADVEDKLKNGLADAPPRAPSAAVASR